MSNAQPAWIGMLAVDDTALAVTDTGGDGPPLVYLNGAYASQRDWRGPIAALGPGYRHVTFDGRARGRSKSSDDYSFAACLRDLDAVVAARGLDRPLLVGWSYGAAIAVHWADRNPDRVRGLVCVDGALPYGMSGEAARDEIRRMFRKMRWLLPLLAPFGLAARMSADRHADINIELNEICLALAAVLERLGCPVRFVLATGASLGGGAEDMEKARAALEPVLARNPNLVVSAKVASNHTAILRRESAAIANAVREVAAIGGTP